MAHKITQSPISAKGESVRRVENVTGRTLARFYSLCVDSSRLVSVPEMPSMRRMRLNA